MVKLLRMARMGICRLLNDVLIITGTIVGFIMVATAIFKLSEFQLPSMLLSALKRSSQVEFQMHFEGVSVPADSPEDEYAIDTPGCRILDTPVWPDYFKKNWDWQNNRVPDCSKEFKHVTLTEDQRFLKLHEDTPEGLCTLWQVKAHPLEDNYFLLVNHGEIKERVIDVEDFEMMKIDCNGTYNFEARIPFKHSAVKKVKYWEKNPGTKPFNVLFIGYDSTSRKHAFRGFNKTVKIMQDMGFLDFRGHHSLVPKTIPNFLTWTSGQNYYETVNSCHPIWEDKYDECPFIWKNYAVHNAITLLIEDPPGTFNFNGQTGFKSPPTDYYIHPLMQALFQVEWDRPWTSRPCVSTETTFKFLKRYMRRFLEQFEGTPYFILNYNNEIFHDLTFAIPSHDEDAEEFFKFLQNSSDVRENTLIVLAGDHGDRFNFFSHDSLDAYLERSLPPLFVRFPDRLTREFPSLVANAVQNTRRLTSPYDIHHTMLHLLALNGFQVTPNISAADFQPCLHDRCSLLAEIPDTRTCDQVKVYKGFCVCNTTRSSKSLDNKFFVDKLTDFAIRELNNAVDSTKYGKICEYWYWLHAADTLISITTLEESEDTKRFLLRFYSAPEMWSTEGEEFSVNLRVLGVKDSEDFGVIELEGDFSRISKYGNQSWCIPDDEQYLKSLCYCKPESEIEEIRAEEEGNKEIVVEVVDNNNDVEQEQNSTVAGAKVDENNYETLDTTQQYESVGGDHQSVETSGRTEPTILHENVQNETNYK